MEAQQTHWRNQDPGTYTKEKAAEWLSKLGLAVSGTREELITTIRLCKRIPRLVEKLRNRTSRNRTFQSSLDPLTIPPIEC